MYDVKSKCKQDGDCLIWQGAKDKVTGHAIARIEEKHCKVVYWLWRVVWKLDLAPRGVLENVCGNKLCMCKEHWRVASPKVGNFVGSVLLNQFMKGLDLPCSYAESMKGLHAVLEKLNRNGAVREAIIKAVDSSKGR